MRKYFLAILSRYRSSHDNGSIRLDRQLTCSNQGSQIQRSKVKLILLMNALLLCTIPLDERVTQRDIHIEDD